VQEGSRLGTNLSRLQANSGSEHDPGWRAAICGDEHQRAQDDSMFNRDNITSARDKLDALRKTAEHLAAQPTKEQEGEVIEMPQGREAVSR